MAPLPDIPVLLTGYPVIITPYLDPTGPSPWEKIKSLLLIAWAPAGTICRISGQYKHLPGPDRTLSTGEDKVPY